MRLEGKVAWVTGGGSGIGASTCMRFAQEGASVLVTDIVGEAASSVADAIIASGGKAWSMQQDVTIEDRWADISGWLLDTAGGLHVLVNNAGVARSGGIEEATLDDFRFVNSVNTEAVFLGMKAAVELMKNTGGSIVNLSSIEGLVGDPLLVAYNASKAAVRMMTKSVALYCANNGYPIRVNSVHPGYCATPMVIDAIEAMGEQGQEMVDRVMAAIPMGRMGDPAEIANGILFLASDESSFMTGSELVIDGGYTAH